MIAVAELAESVMNLEGEDEVSLILERGRR